MKVALSRIAELHFDVVCSAVSQAADHPLSWIAERLHKDFWVSSSHSGETKGRGGATKGAASLVAIPARRRLQN